MHQLRRKKKRGKKYVQLEKNKRRIIAMVNNTTTTINDENEKRKKLNKFCEKLMHNFEHVVTNTTELSYLSVSLFLTGIFLLFFFRAYHYGTRNQVSSQFKNKIQLLYTPYSLGALQTEDCYTY